MAIDQGIKLSDERTRILMKRLDNVYADAYKTAVANNEKALIKFASFKDSDFPDLTSAQIKLKREAYIREINRTKAVYKNIASEISQAGQTASQIIQVEMTNIYGLNYDFAVFDIQKQTGLNLGFSQYDRNQIAVLVKEGQSPFTKIAYRNLGKDTVIVRRLQDQFIQGIMNGESQQQLTRRIKGVTGQSTSQAKRVAQTERNRIQSQGRNQAIHEASEMGIKVDREWSARMVNTRDSHANLNGKTAKEGKPFESILGDIMYPGDPNAIAENVINCFCLIKPKVQSVSPALAKQREKFKQTTFKPEVRK